MNLLLSTGLFNHIEAHRLPDLIGLLREAGFKSVEAVDRQEFETDPDLVDVVRDRAAECDLDIPNWHLVQVTPFQDTPDQSRQAVEQMKQSIDRGYRIGAKNHVVHWFHRSADPADDALWRDIVDQWTDHAATLNVRLLMETAPYYPHQNYAPSSRIAEFVRSYPAGVLAICIDVNHSNLQEKLTDVIPAVADRLASLHVSDNDGQREQHWLPGRGVIDFPALFASLNAVNFNGPLVLEINPWCDRPETPPALKQLCTFFATLAETKTPPPEPLSNPS